MASADYGWCSTCSARVLIDGRPGERVPDDPNPPWSHLRVEMRQVVVPGHAPGCWGDCHKHGCPVPTPDVEPVQVECGPVHIDGSARRWKCVECGRTWDQAETPGSCDTCGVPRTVYPA